MTIPELIKTKRWKTFMNYVYGWGAAIVMIGALFKLEHLKYSGVLLAIGLITEAFIFFLSAFEPPVEMPDWKKVYPELDEEYVHDDTKPKPIDGKCGFNELFASNQLTPELLDQLGKGLTNLSNTAKGISDISSATGATNKYVENLDSASKSMKDLAENNKEANSSINKSVGTLIESYSSTAQYISKTGIGVIETIQKSGDKISIVLSETFKKLADTYSNAGNAFSSEIENMKVSSSQYSSKLQKLNGNLDSFNTNIETQLKGTEEQFKAAQNFSKDLLAMNSILSSSVEELKKYKENAEQLNKHLESLNTIYGNMLGAMSYKK